jgi:hypothetical protein
MEKDNKKDFGKILEAMSEINLKEDLYDKMPKDKLINRLIMCEMELGARSKEAEEHSMELWYFVSDETGVKYLTNEKPKEYLTFDSGKEKWLTIWLTDGEVNIKVPNCMEKMFPEIKYGDKPIKVKVSNITV